MEWGECWLDPVPLPRELAADLKRRTGGVVPGWGPRLTPVPWVVRASAMLIQERVAFMPVGVAVLANSIGRLSVLFETC